MANAFLQIAATPAVKSAQTANGSRHAYARLESGAMDNNRIGQGEAEFLAARDSFYMATISATGWPYVQHRGGPPGFVKILDAKTLAVADFRGNRQYISLGNLAENDRASMILMDYPARRRLKLFVRVAVRDLAADAALAAIVATPGYKGTSERALVFHVEAFDWNCPQHIATRFTEAEISAAITPLTDRLASLEAENDALRTKLAKQSKQNVP